MAFNLDDPSVQWLMATGLGLLGGGGTHKTSFAQDLSRGGLLGMQAYGQAQQSLLKQQADVRANRASDLQQAVGLLQAQQSDPEEVMRQVKAYQSGADYVPSPTMQALRARVQSLAAESGLSGGPAGGMPQVSQTAPRQLLPAPQQPLPTLGPDPSQNMSVPGSQPQPQPQAPPGPNTGWGGPAGGTPMPIWMAAAKNPGMMAYLQAVEKDRAMIPTRFGVYTRDPDNPNQVKLAGGMMPPNALNIEMGPDGKPRIAALPGQLDTQQAVNEASTRGTEAGKFPGREVSVTDASGAVRPTLLQSVVGNPYSKNGMPAPPIGGAPGPTISRPQAATLEVTQPSKQAGNDPWATAPKIPPMTGLGETTYGKGLSAERSKAAATLSESLGNDASTANQRIATNNQALDILDHADTGWLAGNIADFRNVLASVGVPEQAWKAANDQELTKILANTALQRGKQLFGARFTQGEVGIMMSRANPSPEMQKMAIRFLLQTDNATQQYAIQKAQTFGEYLGRGNDPFRFNGWHAGAFPMTDYIKRQVGQMGNSDSQGRPPLSSFSR